MYKRGPEYNLAMAARREGITKLHYLNSRFRVIEDQARRQRWTGEAKDLALLAASELADYVWGKDSQ